MVSFVRCVLYAMQGITCDQKGCSSDEKTIIINMMKLYAYIVKPTLW